MDKGITYNPDGTVSLMYEQHGESVQYTGSSKLPDRNTFPMFKTYQEADAYANSAYYDEEVNGYEVDIFKTGSKKLGNVRYIAGLPEDREKHRLPKGYRWELVML